MQEVAMIITIGRALTSYGPRSALMSLLAHGGQGLQSLRPFCYPEVRVSFLNGSLF